MSFDKFIFKEVVRVDYGPNNSPRSQSMSSTLIYWANPGVVLTSYLQRKTMDVLADGVDKEASVTTMLISIKFKN